MSPRRTVSVDALVVGVLLLAAAWSRGGAPEGKLEVVTAEARVGPSGTGAAYLTIVNPGGEADRLVAVESQAAPLVEMHEVVRREQVLEMVPHPEGFAVPARARLELSPGGKHLMLFDVTPARGQDHIDLTLTFERAGQVQVRAALARP